MKISSIKFKHTQQSKDYQALVTDIITKKASQLDNNSDSRAHQSFHRLCKAYKVKCTLLLNENELPNEVLKSLSRQT